MWGLLEGLPIDAHTCKNFKNEKHKIYSNYKLYMTDSIERYCIHATS